MAEIEPPPQSVEEVNDPIWRRWFWSAYELLDAIKRLIDVLAQINREEVIAFNGLPPTGTGGGDFVNYDDPANIDSEALMTFDPVTGVCTAGADGVYRVSGSLQITGASQNNDYQIQVIRTGSDPASVIAGSVFWSSVQQTLVIPQYSIPIKMLAGDTVKQALVISGGGSVASYGVSSFEVFLDSLL